MESVPASKSNENAAAATLCSKRLCGIPVKPPTAQAEAWIIGSTSVSAADFRSKSKTTKDLMNDLNGLGYY